MTGKPRRTDATDQLTAALVVLAAMGNRPRCSDPQTRELWVSDQEHERAIAATWCAGCPILDECAAAGETNLEQFGVWGGVDRTPVKASTRTAQRPVESSCGERSAARDLGVSGGVTPYSGSSAAPRTGRERHGDVSNTCADAAESMVVSARPSFRRYDPPAPCHPLEAPQRPGASRGGTHPSPKR